MVYMYCDVRHVALRRGACDGEIRIVAFMVLEVLSCLEVPDM
jgi:hypothetical protein